MSPNTVGFWYGANGAYKWGFVQSYLFSPRDAESVRRSIPTILPKASDWKTTHFELTFRLNYRSKRLVIVVKNRPSLFVYKGVCQTDSHGKSMITSYRQIFPETGNRCSSGSQWGPNQLLTWWITAGYYNWLFAWWWGGRSRLLQLVTNLMVRQLQPVTNLMVRWSQPVTNLMVRRSQPVVRAGY